MMGTTCNTHNTCFTPSIMLIYNKHAYINIIFLTKSACYSNEQQHTKTGFQSPTQKTACTVHNQDHPVQIPNYSTTISSRTVVLKTTQTQKPVPTNNNIYRSYSLNQPTTRANRHGHFMALKQRLTSVGENPYLSKVQIRSLLQLLCLLIRELLVLFPFRCLSSFFSFSFSLFFSSFLFPFLSPLPPNKLL